MNRIITTLAALALSAVALAPVAHAGLASSSMVAELTYGGEVGNLAVTFELMDTTTGEPALSVPAVVDASGRGNVQLSAELGLAEWATSDRYEWCVVVDGTRAGERLEVDYLYHQTDARDDLVEGRGENFDGSVGQLCVSGARR